MLAPILPMPAGIAPLNRPTAVLTARGHAALAIVRLDSLLRDLEPDDRAWCLEMLRELLEGREIVG